MTVAPQSRAVARFCRLRSLDERAADSHGTRRLVGLETSRPIGVRAANFVFCLGRLLFAL